MVPAEMGPKRFDALEALKAQAVAARTYALAHRGQFESEGYDLCATPKCQVYAGVPAEDPLSTAAVDATRGLVLSWQGQFADALFVSTCGGTTENVENVFSGGPVPYLVSVECGEIAPFELTGAALPKEGGSRPRSPLAWRGYVLRRHAAAGVAPRAAALETAQGWAGVPRRGSPPAKLTPSAVYPSLIAAFGLADAAALHLTPRDDRYYAELPSAASPLSGSAREAYEFLLRFKFAGDMLPPPDRDLDEDEYAGLLLSADLRLLGVTEGSGRLLSREGSHLWIKSTDGRQELPVDPEVPLARRIGDAFHPARTLTLRAGDRLRFYKRDGRVLAIWVEMESDGPAFERESAWTEWVRRVSGKELARRMSGRVAGNVVRDITVTKRSPSGRAIEMRVQTDLAEATFRRFELRQAVEMPEMLFTVDAGGRRRRPGLRVPGPRLGARRRNVSERSLRDGPRGGAVRPDPAPVLHGDRNRALEHGPGRPSLDPLNRRSCCPRMLPVSTTISSERRAIVDTVRDFCAAEIRPNVMRWDEAQEFPRDVFRKLGELGFLGVLVPEEYGGADLTYMDYQAIVEEIAAVDPSVALSMAAHNSLGSNHIYQYGTPEQRRKYMPRLASGEWLAAWGLTEPEAGSDSSGTKTTAVRDGGSWVLNGSKNFITNASVANVAVLMAVTDREKKNRGISAFIVELDNPGIRVGKKENKLGMRASDTCTLVMEDCRVPAGNLLGQEGEGLVDSMQILDGGRISIAALSIGIARGAFEAALALLPAAAAVRPRAVGVPGDPVLPRRDVDRDRRRAAPHRARRGREGRRRRP